MLVLLALLVVEASPLFDVVDVKATVAIDRARYCRGEKASDVKAIQEVGWKLERRKTTTRLLRNRRKNDEKEFGCQQ